MSKNIKTLLPLKKTKEVYDNFTYYNFSYPIRNIDWLDYRKKYNELINFLEEEEIIDKLDLVIYYGSPSISIFITKLIKFCNSNKIKVISDCVDWLTVKTNNPIFDLIKYVDNHYQKSFANKKTDGVIAISSYLANYYVKSGSLTIVIPPLSPTNYYSSFNEYSTNNKMILTYAGLPFRKDQKIKGTRALKDRIDKIIILLYKAKQSKCNFSFHIFGFEKKEYIKVMPSQMEYIEKLNSNIIFHGQSINDEVVKFISKSDFTILIRDVNKDTTAGFLQKFLKGTTGKSLVAFGTKEDLMKRMALLDHFKSRVGFINKKMKRATFNGKHIIPPNQSKKIFWRYNSACKQMIYSSFHLTEENMKFYVESLNRFKPIAIDGFFTSIYDIAGYIERHNIKLEFTPVSIFPTSETLTKSGRELIENIFKCNVYDQYASSEGAPFVTECKKQVLHIELASGIFEHFKKGSNEILVTSFTTHGTPLIRYRIGDSMIFGNKNLCECGMEAPIVKEIKGRSLDFLYTSEGAKINAGNVANLFKNIPNVLVRAQLIQNKMDEIKILLEIDKRLYKPEHDDY
jgi:phenylacetate-CoA ligase